MEVQDALSETVSIMDGLVAGLTPEHREMTTPCRKFTVHDLMNHTVNTCKLVGTIVSGQPEHVPAEGTDHLAQGPVKGWNDGKTALQSAATAENLELVRETPFGEVPGSVPMSVAVSDVLVHAWDLARATGQPVAASDDLAGFAQGTWEMVIQPEARNGDAFAEVQPCPDDASALDRVAAFTGRSVS